MKHIIVPGQTFGRLTVIEKAEKHKAGHQRWLCICQCGKTHIVLKHNLISGDVKSCGCYNRDQPRTHGLCYTSIYYTWSSMMQRCTNPNANGFKYYGERGITVCERWKIFEHFVTDMGPKPPRMSIERIDNNKGYQPDNCKWATINEQNRNQRNTKLTRHQVHRIREFKWAGATSKELAILFEVSISMIDRIHRGASWA